MLKVGDKIPDVSVQSMSGESVSIMQLAQQSKKALVLYFYPKDETSGCTAEACSFRDSYQQFTDIGATVVGISNDSVDSHKSFAQHHKLPFNLLSDPNGNARRAFGVESSLFGLIPGRATFVISNAGIVLNAFSSQIRPKQHIDIALAVIRYSPMS